MNWHSLVEALRLTAALAAPSPAPDGPNAPSATTAELQALVDHQLARFRPLPFERAKLLSRFAALNDASDGVYVFEVKARRVSVWNKPVVTPVDDLPEVVQWRASAMPHRALLYRVFLQAVVTRHAIDAELTLALDVSDGTFKPSDEPVFAFQKRSDEPTILLPDIDFFHWRWYAGQRDATDYEHKKIAACFVGAATGGHVTEEAVHAGTLQRLRSAAYFTDSPLVSFRIAGPGTCATAAARRLVRKQRYFSPPVTWAEQLGYRFLISIDGNGAACSRLAISLLSHSVVLKYRSPSSLYYFPAMVAGRDYLDIVQDAEVEEIVRTEQNEPGHFKPIAEAGRRFAERFLNERSVVQYTALLLADYARLYAAA